MGELLRSGALDVYLGILADDEIDSSIYTKPITQVEHGIVLRQEDPISQNDMVNPTDILVYTWVSFTIDPVTEHRIEEYALPKGSKKSLIRIRTTSLATGVQLVKTGRFVMSAPLQLANVVKRDGLVIRPVLHRMQPRQAGIYVRKSSLEHGAIKSAIAFLENANIPS